MVTNAMFYQIGGEDDPSTTLHLGPFAFSPSQIYIGLVTSLIIFPVNILIVGVFRSIGPKPSKEEMAKKKAKRFWWIRELFFCCQEKKKNDFMDIIQDSEASGRASRATIVSETMTLDGDEIGLKMETATQEKRREEKAKKMKKKKKKLPYWMKYFAWTLLIMTSFTSAFFVVLYGFTFGKEKSAQWISALFISFIQDVLVSQPTKILGLALFIALIVKKPAEDDEEDEEGNKKQIDEEYLDNQDTSRQNATRPKMAKNDIIKFQPPSKEKIAALRTYRLKEIKMYNLIREIVMYCLFVIALCQVTYSFMDPRSYFVRKSLQDTFVSASYGGDKKFHEISSVNDIWSWLETTVMTGLYATHWYNGEANEPGFTQDLSSNLFGGSRIRQLRIREQSCEVHEKFIDMIPNCHAWYSWGNEDTEYYDPGWKPLTNHSSINDPANHLGCWKFQTSSELDTYPFVGALAAYGGGGYVGSMGKSPRESKALLESLKKNMWLDDQTRAVFLEVTVYNAQVNLFAIMNFVAEILPTNGAEVFHSIKIARLYTFGGDMESFTMACQVFVAIFFIIFIYKEGKKIYRERKAYFKGFWNLLEFSIIILVFATVAVFFSRKILVDKAVEKIESDPGAFVSFNKVVQWDTMFTAFTSVLVLLSCIKAIKLLQYNKTISLLASTLKGSAKPLAAFFVVFSVFFIAFTTFAYLMFVPHLSDYKSFLTASESVLSLLLGGFEYAEISETKRILGPIWFFLIMMFGVMYLMNVFLSIVMETYANVKDDLSKQNQEYELVEFMVKKFMHVLGRGDGGKKEVLAKVTEAEEKRARQEAAKLKKKNRKMATVKTNTKSYQKLDDEIETKFAQLDNSLNGYWNKYFTDDHHGNSNAYTNNAFDYQEFQEEVEIENDMKAELAKWQ